MSHLAGPVHGLLSVDVDDAFPWTTALHWCLILIRRYHLATTMKKGGGGGSQGEEEGEEEEALRVFKVSDHVLSLPLGIHQACYLASAATTSSWPFFQLPDLASSPGRLSYLCPLNDPSTGRVWTGTLMRRTDTYRRGEVKTHFPPWWFSPSAPRYDFEWRPAGFRPSNSAQREKKGKNVDIVGLSGQTGRSPKEEGGFSFIYRPSPLSLVADLVVRVTERSSA